MAITARYIEEHKKVVLPWSGVFKNLVGWGSTFEVEGVRFFQVPDNDDSARLLGNMKVDIIPPIRRYYDWSNFKPWDCQYATASLLSISPRCYVLNDLGTGKTLSSLWAADWLIQTKQVRKVVVACPLSTMTIVWLKEILLYLPHLSAAVIHGTKKKRQKLLEEEHDVYIVNHDGVKVVNDELRKLPGLDLVIIDELASFRTKRTDKWKAMNALVQGRKYVWGLTGKPTPGGPTDAYAQCKLLTPNSVPKYFGQWRDMTETKITQFKYLPKPDAMETVFRAMQPSIRRELDEQHDIPPVNYITREVTLEADLTAAYRKMVKTLKIEHEQGTITAHNAGVKMFKLLQLAAGFAYSDDGHAINIGGAKRLEEIEALVEQTDYKVLIFCPFRHLTDTVHKRLSKRWKLGIVDGRVSVKERNKAFNELQHGGAKGIVAHPRAMAHGVNLPAANLIVWVTPYPSLETVDQANARMRRPGQKHKMINATLFGTPVEKHIMNLLNNRGKMQDVLLNMFKELET